MYAVQLQEKIKRINQFKVHHILKFRKISPKINKLQHDWSSTTSITNQQLLSSTPSNPNQTCTTLRATKDPICLSERNQANPYRIKNLPKNKTRPIWSETHTRNKLKESNSIPYKKATKGFPGKKERKEKKFAEKIKTVFTW
jgi:hypothetical protein